MSRRLFVGAFSALVLSTLGAAAADALVDVNTQNELVRGQDYFAQCSKKQRTVTLVVSHNLPFKIHCRADCTTSLGDKILHVYELERDVIIATPFKATYTIGKPGGIDAKTRFTSLQCWRYWP